MSYIHQYKSKANSPIFAYYDYDHKKLYIFYYTTYYDHDYKKHYISI